MEEDFAVLESPFTAELETLPFLESPFTAELETLVAKDIYNNGVYYARITV